MSLRDADEAPPPAEETAASGEAAAALRTRLAATLNELARRSLLEVDGWFDDDTPATYRFQPALRQEAERRLEEAKKEVQRKGYAAYGAWLAKRGYGDIHSDIGLNRLVRLSMDALDKATDELEGSERLWHIRRLAWLKNAWGEVHAAFDLLNTALTAALPDPAADPESAKVQSSIRFELAGVYITNGDLDRALQLYEESLALKEQLGDKQGKAASLHQMAAVFLTRGDLDRALQLYEESTELSEQLGDKKGKAASLSNMAQVFLTRGDLDRALQLYEESLALLEQLGDKKGKAASLHQMAAVFLTRGDLDRALQLYEESLALLEQLGDKKGKAASLSNMAQVFLTRGDLDRALQLYEESTELSEQLGDKKGKAASLHQMAAVFLTRGDLDRALQLYEESLALLEQLGDKKGKAASLNQMANLFMMKEDFDSAEHSLNVSLELMQQLGYSAGVSFSIVKLGQIAQARGDKETALTRYREGLAIFERMGMPEANQVRGMITSLDLPPSPSPERRGEPDPLAQAIGQARAAAERGDLPAAIQFQEGAVRLARERESGEQGKENSQTLFVQMVNLAQYYAMGEQFDNALALLDESLKMGEAIKHPELDAVRQIRDAIQKLSSMSPEERAQLQHAQASTPASGGGERDDFEMQLQEQLAQLPVEQCAEAEKQIRRTFEEYQRMNPEEKAAFEARARRAQIDNAAGQVRDAALAYVRRQAPKRDVLGFLADSSSKMKSGEEPGSPWLEVAQLCDALVALLNEDASLPPVPVVYASHFSAVQSEMQRMKGQG